jgi:hypothetical protein
MKLAMTVQGESDALSTESSEQTTGTSEEGD